MNVDINFENIYPFEIMDPDCSKFTFICPVFDKDSVTLTVTIKPTYNQFMQDYMNLAFGPMADGKIDDFAAIRHTNLSKTISTVLYCGYKFLEANPGAYIGIDGSDFRRAYFYYRILQRNYTYLHKHFSIRGIKYYARLRRGNDKNDFLQVDPEEVTYKAYIIENKPLKDHKSLFNYFVLYHK